MKSITTIVGVLLIVLGIVGFSYKYISYTQREEVAQVGSVQITADQEKTVFISPMVSGISLAAGLVLVIVGMRRRG